MIEVQNCAIKQLQHAGYFSGSLNSLFVGSDALELSSYAPYWDRLGVDKFMRDGGTYRQRRFGESIYEMRQDEFSNLDPRPHFQPTSINPLNGGIARVFEPTEPEFRLSMLHSCIVKQLGRELSKLEGGCDWRINVHQVRITADAQTVGMPVPEGIHRDGITYGILIMMDRLNITSGGHTKIFSPLKEVLFERTLLNLGDCLLYDDRLFLHDTSSIVALAGTTAHRDMFIVEFSKPEDETQKIT